MSPCGKLAALAFVFKQWDAVSAGIGDARNLDQNDGPRPLDTRESERRDPQIPYVQVQSPFHAHIGEEFLAVPGRRRTSRRFGRFPSGEKPSPSRFRSGPDRQLSAGPRIRSVSSPFGETLICPSEIERRRPHKEERLGLDKFPDGIVNRRKIFPTGAAPSSNPSMASEVGRASACRFCSSSPSRPARTEPDTAEARPTGSSSLYIRLGV